MEDILALIGRVHQGDKEARDILVEKNMGLVRSIVKRFQNRGVETEDLLQIGSIGLLKAVKVSRSLKETAAKAYGARERLLLKNNREPSMEEIADEVGISREELVMALESGAQVESLQKTIFESDGSDIALEDKLPQEKSQQEEILNKMFLEEILGELDAKERELIYLRFFQEKTQAYIGEKMGLSQVQVSRLEKKILSRLREKI